MARIVQSWCGWKYVCEENGECSNADCNRAHPNSSGSTCRSYIWCAEGSIDGCKKPTCVFNHHTTTSKYNTWRYREDPSGLPYENIVYQPIVDYAVKWEPSTPEHQVPAPLTFADKAIIRTPRREFTKQCKSANNGLSINRRTLLPPLN